jgi:hypothetical protein
VASHAEAIRAQNALFHVCSGFAPALASGNIDPTTLECCDAPMVSAAIPQRPLRGCSVRPALHICAAGM